MHVRCGEAAIAAVVLLAGGVSAAGGGAVRAARVGAITVDGDIADWKSVPVQYYENGPRVTAVARDDRFLFVQFRFSDLALARRVLRSGAIVWVNGDGKHEPGFGLRFRGTPAVEKALQELDGAGGAPAPPGGQPGGGSPPVGMPAPPGGMRGGGPPTGGPTPERPPLGALEVLRDGVVDEVIASGAVPDGLAAAAAVADGVFAFELRVPLAELARSGVATGAGAAAGGATRAAVGFQMNGMTGAERETMRERMRSGGGFGGGFGGGRGGPGGDLPGGGMPGGPEGRTRGGETVWVDVELAEAVQAAAPAK